MLRTPAGLDHSDLLVVHVPVPSWRLSRSMGVDPVPTAGKTCTFDRLYCQLGRTVHVAARRGAFVGPHALRQQLATSGDVLIDVPTFSGVGEPTLAGNLSDLVVVARAMVPDRPIAILAKSLLIWRKHVRADEVQLNTPMQPCPAKPLSADEMVAIQAEFSGLSMDCTLMEGGYA